MFGQSPEHTLSVWPDNMILGRYYNLFLGEFASLIELLHLSKCMHVTTRVATTELWVDDDFEMIAVEVKGMDLKYTWEIIGIYRAPNEDMLVLKN